MVNDPAIYTKPFVLGTSKFVWVPNQQSEEQICVPVAKHCLREYHQRSRGAQSGAE